MEVSTSVVKVLCVYGGISFHCPPPPSPEHKPSTYSIDTNRDDKGALNIAAANVNFMSGVMVIPGVYVFS